MKIKVLVLTGLLAGSALQAQASGHLSNYDRQIVASCMVLEAGGEGTDGMQAVLNVILNRAGGYLHRMVPETVKHGAFSCMSSIWHSPYPDYSLLIRRAQSQGDVFATALQLLSVMEQGLLWDNTYGATHYHADYIRPYWVSDMRYLTTIGAHHFYIERGAQVASL